ncbi:hypothetical protein PSTG_07859 [Puccinia striiformis f. sp. tritici PST-78]|uniref:Uncharacterized protein n=1 Tax=Puccinia striiformis f. sp. tritici PST-78 TaxID=1165861 RepID=A0A0L0VHR7_9BASI|nr:hypothetical protein PSTG_07859 [Puccinia striiformis f. sp. tritici PST-78]
MSLTVLRRLTIAKAPRRRPTGSIVACPSAAVQYRSFFGIGELLGILANPGETIRSLAESKRLLEETRAEMLEHKERNSIPPKHTFAPPPGLQYREKEVKVLKTCLSSIPNFTVIFGGTSVGKTALLRQVLTHERYHVIHFDLRMAGFADVSSLFFSFSRQMEQYFVSLASRLEGYEIFEKEALAFKHLRLDSQRRVEKNGPPIKTSDIAHLLEIFQSCLLKYWEFSPVNPEETENEKESISNKPMKEWERKKMKSVQDKLKQEMSFSERGGDHQMMDDQADSKPEAKGMEASRSVEFVESSDQSSARENHNQDLDQSGNSQDDSEQSTEWKPPTKLIPVIFIDEAHKLPALIKDQETMKCILDGLLVLTKQDRLCHVINATSDPFYMNWLRNMNVLTHCTIITIGDPTKKEAQEYFNENLLNNLKKKLDQQPSVSDSREGNSGNMILKRQSLEANQSTGTTQQSHNGRSDDSTYELDFESCYDNFGGKLAHLQGFVGDYLNSGGRLKPKQSSPFIQAYTLLLYHLVNPQYLARETDEPRCPISPYSHRLPNKETLSANTAQVEGFMSEKCEGSTLLYVISKFTSFAVERSTGKIILADENSSSPPTSPSGEESQRTPKASVPVQTCSYFQLCREVGIQSVDHLVRNRILDLRWTHPVSIDPRNSPPTLHTLLTLADVEPVLLPISPVMRVAMQSVLEQHFHENLLA